MSSILAVFDFIYTFLDTIIKGVYGLFHIVQATLLLINAIIRILPDPFYMCMVVFIRCYIAIFAYKIVRTGKG